MHSKPRALIRPRLDVLEPSAREQRHPPLIDYSQGAIDYRVGEIQYGSP